MDAGLRWRGYLPLAVVVYQVTRSSGAIKMIVIASQLVILTLGFIVFVLSAWGVVAPDRLIRFVTSSMDRPWGIHVAVIVRLLLGAALIGIAPASLFPMTFQVLGVLSLLAAVALAVSGRERVRRFLDWSLERFSPVFNRLWLLFGMAFGAFLVFGVL